MDIPTISVSFV